MGKMALATKGHAVGMASVCSVTYKDAVWNVSEMGRDICCPLWFSGERKDTLWIQMSLSIFDIHSIITPSNVN